MATLLQAIATYRPRIVNSRTMELGELADHLAVGTLVTAPIARMVLEELGRQALLQGRAGIKIRLPGIGLISQDLRMDGTPFPVIRLDKDLRGGLADRDAFHADIKHREMIGVPLAAYKARWDAEHPDDPVILTDQERAA